MIVFYDLETTGLVRGFDQILQFGAIRTDDELHENGRFEIRSRLMPNVVPSPDAMRVTGQRIEDLTDPARPSHYGMVCAIRERLRSWSPALFLGWNSMRFDEEFLRQAFYQTLHPPYLTNCNGNSRADVLDIVRAVVALRPGTICVPRAADGRPVFKLDALAPANGIGHGDAHDAIADVRAMVEVSRLVRERAPDLWSHFLGFRHKSAVRNFTAREEAFLCLGRPGDPPALAALGPGSRYPNAIHCFDLAADPNDFAASSGELLAAALAGPPSRLKRLKSNCAPLLWPLRDAPANLLRGMSVVDLQARAHGLQRSPDLIAKLRACAEACERTYPPSVHVERQLYESGFWSDQDSELLAQFHASPWEERPSLLRQLADPRLRRLGWRLLFFERPDLLDGEARAVAAKAMALRLLGLKGRDQPWLSVPDALLELEGGISGGDQRDDDTLGSYRARLAAWLTDSARVLDAGDPAKAGALPKTDLPVPRPSARQAPAPAPLVQGPPEHCRDR